jgi:4'-phosphopantetheinyl transferase
MTDRADWAVCVALSADRSGGAVGCDLEVVEPRSDRFVADWFTASERELVGADPDERDVLANLIWSAKESALKVLRTGLRRDTRSVEVSLPPDESVDGWARLRVTTDEGLRFDGWWCRFGQFILTCAADRPIPPPTSLVEPAALLAAEPTHRWMANPRPPAPN